MCEIKQATTREFRVDSGKLVQCAECKSLGIEIGSAYFVVDPEEIHEFTQWYRSIVAVERSRTRSRERLYLQIEHSRIMLALSERELRDLDTLLVKGARWAGANLETTTPHHLSDHHLSDLVH